MSGSSIFSVSRRSAAVPPGPKTARGLGAKDSTHRVVKTSFRSRDVVAVEMRQEQGPDQSRTRPDRGGPHQDAAPAVEEQVPGRGTHQRRRAGTHRIGKRTATAQDDHLHARSSSDRSSLSAKRLANR